MNPTPSAITPSTQRAGHSGNSNCRPNHPFTPPHTPQPRINPRFAPTPLHQRHESRQKRQTPAADPINHPISHPILLTARRHARLRATANPDMIKCWKRPARATTPSKPSRHSAHAMKGPQAMQLQFELGDPNAPRGHAILFARAGANAQTILATYCVVLPIQFSIAKFLPPILSGQLPLEGLRDAAAMSVVPMPPMLEDSTSLAQLRTLAERRSDDLCDMGTIFINDDSQRMTYAAEGCQSYGELFAAYAQRWPTLASAPAATPIDTAPLPELNIEDIMAEVLPERDRLSELARLAGQARYAIDGHDKRLLDDVGSSMRRIASALPEKYRGDQLVESALRDDPTAARLAELYLQRAYKMLEEDYSGIPPIEREIRALRGDNSGASPTDNSPTPER